MRAAVLAGSAADPWARLSGCPREPGSCSASRANERSLGPLRWLLQCARSERAGRCIRRLLRTKCRVQGLPLGFDREDNLHTAEVPANPGVASRARFVPQRDARIVESMRLAA